jgi:uracil-DNA glycosylase family 4
VGEAPGEQEDLTGIPFVGKAGIERDNYMRRVGIADLPRYTTNVIKCRPPRNRDPKPDEISACMEHLEAELAVLPQDAIIITLGRFATRWFLGEEADSEVLHGIPQEWDGHVLIPAYHPAAGLHNTSMMTRIFEDFTNIGKVVRGERVKVDDEYPDPTYEHWTKVRREGNIWGVDTESDGSKPWSIQFSTQPGTGYFIPADKEGGVLWLKERLENPANLTVFHFSQHDLPILRNLGIRPARFTDTFLMANLLQNVPRGLKALAYRLCGMDMLDYSDMIYPYTQSKVRSYLEEAVQYQWPTPDPEQKREKDGSWRIVQPQDMTRKIKSILKKEGVDLWDWWRKTGGTEVVEEALGGLGPATIADVPFSVAMRYASRDPDATLRVFHQLYPRIISEGLKDVLERDIREVPYVVMIEEAGAPVDTEYFRKLGEEFQDRCFTVENRLQGRIGYWINPGSDDQASKLLFTRLGMKPIKRTKGGGFSTDNSVLERLKGSNSVIDDIIEYRQFETLKSSFVDVILREVREGRIYSRWSMGTVETGRLSCKDPINLMAIPVRTMEGRRVRDGFVARPGCSFLSADYSQIEMRVVAHDSQDEVMMGIFRRNADIHVETACAAFQLPPGEIDEMEHRYPAKRVGFGVLNDISPSGLLRELEVGGAKGWTEGRCQDFIERWFSIYSGVKLYMEEKRVEARRTREVRDMFGRKRLVPEVISAHFWIREAGTRQAANAPIQMGAQGIIKQAMGDLVPTIEEFNQQGSIFIPWAQIHDDLPFEVEDDILPIVAPIIKSTMENAVELDVPITVDLKVGKRWGSMEKYKI